MDRQREIARLLAQQPRRSMTRRDLLRRVGLSAGAASLTAVLAACGIKKEDTADSGEKNTLTTDEEVGNLNFANWPLYIDRVQGRRPTLDDFTKETGIAVNYKEVIDDNEGFFGTIQEPLSNDQPIEWDLIVVTDWMLAKMARLGYLEELDLSKLPNFTANAGEIYKDPSYDPGNKHSVPWQSGITGIAYNPELTGRELSTFDDLFDPAFAGKVGMFKEMRDTFSLTLLSMGIEPRDSTEDDLMAAQEKLIQQRDDGIVRNYYGNEYADALVRGDIWATIAWSGDVFQLQFDKPELQFYVPDTGGILWVDNMAIPENAAAPIDAMKFMDFVYDPEIAAQITAWVNYICPVPAAKEILEASDDPTTQTVAASPLVFPTPEMEANLHSYKDLDEEEEQLWNDLFGEIIQG